MGGAPVPSPKRLQESSSVGDSDCVPENQRAFLSGILLVPAPSGSHRAENDAIYGVM